MSIPSPLLKYRKMKARKLFTWLFQSQVRSWLGMTLGIWVIASTVYYYWLVSKIAMLETQNKINRTQLKLSVVKQMSVDSPTTYQVPVIPDTEGTLCETIHLSLVCMGKCPRQVTPMLKSLLQHRQNPLHFHMIVDASSHHTISKLFDTWNLPDVKYTCYNAESKLAHVRWVPNSHYSGIFALLKLLYPDILPTTLAQVIVLDSDLTFLCDIAELWALFRNMSRQQLIGVVENESNWYYESTVTRWPAFGRGYNTGVVTGSSFHSLYKYLIGVVENESNWYYESTVTRWPALGRGYNTGVMLMDLKKIRTDIDWSILWHDTVINNIPKLKQTALADQDIINAIIKSNPHLVYNISCQYNVQMSTKTLAKNCYGEDVANVKILHWNSPNKHSIKVRDADYFRSIYQSYVNLDGNLLTQKLHRCDRTEPDNNKINYSDLCVSFRSAQRVKLRTHLYYMEYSPPDAEPFDVTLVLQLSMDRLQFLERIVKFWEGPLSAAIYLSDCEVTKLESFIQNSSDALSSRRNIGYHLVYKQDSVHYPVNYLRNVALENVNTPYVFLMDADFVPMAGLYDHLRSSIKLINPYPQKKCLVVAAFETQRYRAVPPRSKQALLARLASAHAAGDVAPFRAREWPRGHRPTNYTRWRTAEAPYEVEWEPDYEPYLVVHWTVPKYDTRFSGFGWNKVSHSVELRAQGYKAVVLPAAFVVHTPHAPSLDISAFRADPHYRICLALLKQEFMEDLKRKYNVTFDDAAKSDALLEQSKNFILNQAKNDEK